MNDSAVLEKVLQAVAAARVVTLQALASYLRKPKTASKAVLHDRVVLEITSRRGQSSFRADCAALLRICGLPIAFALDEVPSPLASPSAAAAGPPLPPGAAAGAPTPAPVPGAAAGVPAPAPVPPPPHTLSALAQPPPRATPPPRVPPAAPAASLPPQPAVNWNPWTAPAAGLPATAPRPFDRRGCPCGLAASTGPCVKCSTPGCGARYHVRCLAFPTPTPPDNWRCAVCRAAGMMPFAELQQASGGGVW